MKHHIVISGTGRAGTTFLMQLLTALNFDTGFSSKDEMFDANSQAGMELDLRDDNCPFIIKSPFVCDYIESVLNQKKIKIEHLILPVRDLYDAAESRIDVVRRFKAKQGLSDRASMQITGGLWGTESFEMQKAVLAHKFYMLIYTATRFNIPITFLDFPRIVHDPLYLRKKLTTIFGKEKLMPKAFNKIFYEISRPELIHSFKNNKKNEFKETIFLKFQFFIRKFFNSIF